MKDPVSLGERCVKNSNEQEQYLLIGRDLTSIKLIPTGEAMHLLIKWKDRKTLSEPFIKIYN